MKIRLYNKSDEENVKKLIKEVLVSIDCFFVKEWEDFSKYSVFFIAEENEDIVGCAALKNVDSKTVKLKRMYVKTVLQRTGIGNALLGKVIEYALKNKFNRIILTTYFEMKDAVRFYEKNGFKIVKNPSEEFFTNPALKEYNEKQIAMEKKL